MEEVDPIVRRRGELWGLCLMLVGTGGITAVPAGATVLRMTPTVDAQVDEATSTVGLKWKVTNEGDEAAQDVALDLPALNESHPFASTLAPEQSATVELKIPFDKLAIRTKGSYALFYRILYKDANFYAFSAPYSVSLLLPPAPSRMLTGSIDGASEIQLSEQAARSITVQNVAPAEITVDRVEAIAPVEITVAFPGLVLPLKLAPQERRTLQVELTRAGALLGSTYVLGALFSGTSGERHFAERVGFTARLVGSVWSGRTLMGVALALLVVGTLVVWLRQRKRPASR